MGQSGSVPQVTRDYDEPLRLRLRFQYDPDKTEVKTPFTAKQVATLVRIKWPPFFNRLTAFGGGWGTPGR